MTTKTITLCGKEVTIAYCNATEIAFKIMSGENIFDFLNDEIVPAIKANPARMCDMEKSIFLVLSASKAYYEYIGEENPVTDRELMYEAGPNDIPTALAAFIEIYGNFYAKPKGEPEDVQKEESPKNA